MGKSAYFTKESLTNKKMHFILLQLENANFALHPCSKKVSANKRAAEEYKR